MKRSAALLLLVLTLTASPAHMHGGQDDPLAEKIRTIEQEYGVRAGVAALDPARSISFRYNADSLFPTASIIKLPVLVTLFRQFDDGVRTRDEMVTVAESSLVPGSGILQHLRPGESLRLVNMATLMIILSDNSATNLVIGRLAPDHEAQLEAVNGTMRSLGLTATRLLNKPYSFATKKNTEEARRFGIGVSTPDDMVALMRSIVTNSALHRESCREVIDILGRQQDRELAARYLPFSEDTTLRIADKTGSLDDVKNDVGMVGSATGAYLYAIFCCDAEETGEAVDNRASLAVARISRELCRVFLGK